MTTENEKSTGINYSKVVIRDEHGTVDPTATMERINAELVEWIATYEIDPDAIKTATAAVFAKFPKTEKAQIDLGGLTTNALKELNAPLGAETRIGERIKDFVRGESKRFEATKGAEGLVHILRGKSGGVHFSTEAYVAEYRAKLAKKAAANVAE